MSLLWPPAAAQLHIDAPQLRRTPLDFSQATLNWPASGGRLQSFIPGPDMDRPWMRRKPLPCTSPATPRPVRTGPTGMPARTRTSLKGVLAVSLCQFVQLLLTFRSCHSTCLTASHSLLGLLSMPGALTRRPRHGCASIQKSGLRPPSPSSLSPLPRQQRYLPRSSPNVSGQGYRPPSNGLLADGAAQSCIGAHGSPWILPLSVSRFPVTRASLSPLMDRALNL
jgi:hypothetical protein